MGAEEQDELVKILQEESYNIKARMIQMTEQNSKLNKEIALAREGAAAHYSLIIEAKDKEIERLKEICKDQSSE